eukprot:Lankesteria_metandrocarpae@DN5475_c3_g1_i12.p1
MQTSKRCEDSAGNHYYTSSTGGLTGVCTRSLLKKIRQLYYNADGSTKTDAAVWRGTTSCHHSRVRGPSSPDEVIRSHRRNGHDKRNRGTYDAELLKPDGCDIFWQKSVDEEERPVAGVTAEVRTEQAHQDSLWIESRCASLISDEIFKVNQYAVSRCQEIALELQRIARVIAEHSTLYESSCYDPSAGGHASAATSSSSSRSDGHAATTHRSKYSGASTTEHGSSTTATTTVTDTGTSYFTPRTTTTTTACNSTPIKSPTTGRTTTVQSHSTSVTTTADQMFIAAAVPVSVDDFEHSAEEDCASLGCRLTGKHLQHYHEYIRREIEAKGNHIARLELFIQANFRSLTSVQKKVDKITGMRTVPWFVANLLREPFANVNFDNLLLLLSLLWERYRRFESVSKSGVRGADEDMKSKWAPPSSFSRNTVKYWVAPENVTLAKVLILQHLPYLIFGASSEELEVLLDPFVLATDPTRSSVPFPHNAQLVSSVYFDSPDAYSYCRRVRRLEGAQLLRLRWYNYNAGQPDKDIFVERKTHHEAWSGMKSSKDRFQLPQRHALEFMQGGLDIEKFLKDKKSKPSTVELGTSVQQSILRHNLKPMLRTSYLRSAFQLASTNEVRISLDTNLCMVDEFIESGGLSGHQWCRVGDEILAADEVVRFPFAILEVKLQTESVPDWIASMLAKTGSVAVHKFSKFQHGMSLLHRPRVAGIGLPHWVGHLEKKGFSTGFAPAQSTLNVGSSNKGPIRVPYRQHQQQLPTFASVTIEVGTGDAIGDHHSNRVLLNETVDELFPNALMPQHDHQGLASDQVVQDECRCRICVN